MLQKQTEGCLRDGVAYQWETTWDDETGSAEILEFNDKRELVRRCDWRIWPESEQTAEQVGEAIWYDASGVEIERCPIGGGRLDGVTPSAESDQP